MKIETKSLSTALHNVTQSVSKRTTLPILNCVLLSAKDGRLTIDATDLDCWLGIQLECEGELAPFCVPTSMLATVIGGEQTTLTYDDGKQRLIVKGVGTATLATQKAEEFPSVPELGLALGVPISDLADGIEGVCWCTDDGETRTVAKGVFVQTKPKLMRCVGTDFKACSLFSRALICAESEFGFPNKYAKAFAVAMREPEATVHLSDKYVTVQHANGFCAVHLFEDQRFPGVDSGFPKAKEQQDLGRFDFAEVLDTALMAKALTDGDRRADLVFTFEPSKLTLSYTGASNQLEHTIKREGGTDSKLTVDAVRMIEVLRNTGQEKVRCYRNERGIFFEDGDRVNALSLINKP